MMPRERDQGCQMAFFKPKIPIWVHIFKGLAIEDVGISCFTVLLPFGLFCGH
jgi:hypothetical protein